MNNTTDNFCRFYKEIRDLLIVERVRLQQVIREKFRLRAEAEQQAHEAGYERPELFAGNRAQQRQD
jgi:hypothetical protein